MVLGCTSTAGKSLLVTALADGSPDRASTSRRSRHRTCRTTRRVVDGGEIGVAQWLQARAAGLEPTVDMNPVLLEAGGRHPQPSRGRRRRPPRSHRTAVAGASPAPVAGDDRRVRAASPTGTSLVLLEGAGSPAEINLPDLVNNRMLQHADAVCAARRRHRPRRRVRTPLRHVVARAVTTRERLGGFVLNKFRGDAALLEPGPDDAHRAHRHGDGRLCFRCWSTSLPDEEGGTIRATPPAGATDGRGRPLPVRVEPRRAAAGAVTRRGCDGRPTRADIDGVDLVVLPGSKHVAADVAWLREQHLDVRIRASAAAGGRVLGLCGGAMLLGTEVRDPSGVEGATHRARAAAARTRRCRRRS